jgi:hypothetical protein
VCSEDECGYNKKNESVCVNDNENQTVCARARACVCVCWMWAGVCVFSKRSCVIGLEEGKCFIKNKKKRKKKKRR